MAWHCPRCGGEIFKDEQNICDGCIAEDVAIMFEDTGVHDDYDYPYRREPDPNQCDCGDTLNVYGVCPACQM